MWNKSAKGQSDLIHQYKYICIQINRIENRLYQMMTNILPWITKARFPSSGRKGF